MSLDWRLDKLTEEQRAVVLAEPDRDILVSASAGSGKTHVLSERISYRISEFAMDLKRILVLTFTEAASASMKKRIEDKINYYIEENRVRRSKEKDLEKIEKYKESTRNLLAAREDLSVCKITTFHSFCKALIDENIGQLQSLDNSSLHPSYRVLDEADANSILYKSCTEVIDRYYNEEEFFKIKENKRELNELSQNEFFLLSSLLGSGKNDRVLIDVLATFYKNLRNYPNYLSFLENKIIENEKIANVFDSDEDVYFFDFLIKHVKKYSQKFRYEIELVNNYFLRVLDKCKEEAIYKDDRSLCVYYALRQINNTLNDIRGDFLDGKNCNLDNNDPIVNIRKILKKYFALSKRYQLAVCMFKIPSEQTLNKNTELKELVADLATKISLWIKDGEKTEFEINLADLDFLKKLKGLALSKNFPFSGMVELLQLIDVYFYYLFDIAIKSDNKKKYTLDFHPFKYDEEIYVEESKNISSLLKILQSIIIDIEKQYKKNKLKENAVDFSDLIHLAYKLIDENKDEYQRLYDEVYIDEYQDTSVIQEKLFSNLAAGKRFMVGDMKQSIYRFQGAEISNFRDKELNEDKNTNVFRLSTNFRTKSYLLDFINSFFTKIMTSELGEIEYDQTQFMFPYSGNISEKAVPELLGNNVDEDIIKFSKEEKYISKDDYDKFVKIINIETLNTKSLENEMFREAFADLINEYRIDTKDLLEQENNMPYYFLAEYVKKLKNDKKIEFKDIAIISRNNQELAKIATILNLCNIPSSIAYESGELYSKRELESFIKLLSNRMQDDALLAYLLSDLNIYRFSHEELAKISADSKNFYKNTRESFCYRFYNYPSLAEETELRNKVAACISDLESLADMARYQSSYDFFSYMYDRVDYERVCSSRDSAAEEVKFARDFLKYLASEKATAIKFIVNIGENLNNSSLSDIVKVNDDEDAEAIRLLTYHKSKGLEFKEVILYMGAGKLKYRDDSSVSIDNDFGLATLNIEKNYGFKYKSLKKQLYNIYDQQKYYSEELRIIYVALTRAKEGMHIILKNCDLSGELEPEYMFKFVDLNDPEIFEYKQMRNSRAKYFTECNAIDDKSKFTHSTESWLKSLVIDSERINISNMNYDELMKLQNLLPDVSEINCRPYYESRLSIREYFEKQLSNTNDSNNSLTKENDSYNLLMDKSRNYIFINIRLNREVIYKKYRNIITDISSELKKNVYSILQKKTDGNIDEMMKENERLHIYNNTLSPIQIIGSIDEDKLTLAEFIKLNSKETNDKLNNLQSKYAASAISKQTTINENLLHINKQNLKNKEIGIGILAARREDEDFNLSEHLENEEILNLYPAINETLLHISDILDSVANGDIYRDLPENTTSTDEACDEPLSFEYAQETMKEYYFDDKVSESDHKPKANELGSLYHNLMRYLDFKKLIVSYTNNSFDEEVNRQLEEIIKFNLISKKNIFYLKEYIDSIYAFISSELIKSFYITKDTDKVDSEQYIEFKEKSFTMELEEKELFNHIGVAWPNISPSETGREIENKRTLSDSEYNKFNDGAKFYVQGVVDLMFVSENEAVIIDYKTDKLSSDSLPNSRIVADLIVDKTDENLITLQKRYKKQMDIYTAALEKAWDIKVKSRYIYSTYSCKFYSI